MNTLKEQMLDKIKTADHAYYALDNPIMTDAEYDSLRAKFIKTYGIRDLNYVPGEVSNDFIPFKHQVPVISLSKIKRTDTDKFLKEIKKLWPVVYEPKIDGLTVVAYPNKDGSCKFVTRGNGKIGEILPNFISKYMGTNVNNTGYPIRGEVYLGYNEFKEINYDRKIKGETLFKNPRNAAAGILRNKECSPYINKLNYLCYDILGQDISEKDKLDLIESKSKFTTVPYFEGDNPNDINDMVEDFYINYVDGNIPIDGVVIKSNLNKSLEKFGFTNHHPNNAFAWKDIGEKSITKILDVKWNVGRSKITPVAILEPVELNGSTISKVSIHNLNIIKKLNLHYNDTVEIEKVNEVIPQITRVINREENSTPINKILYCPCCNSILEEQNGQLYCTNKNCDDRLIREIEYLSSKEMFDIKGLSNKTIKKIIQANLIKDGPMSIFNLKTSDLISLEGLGFKSATKLIQEINNVLSVDIPLSTFIAATCINGIGKDVGKILATKYRTIDKIINACKTKEDFTTLYGIGSETNIILHSQDFIDKLVYLLKWLTPKECNKQINANSKLFVITGILTKPRNYYKQLIEKHGHKVVDSISKKVNYLLVGENAGSKLDKAIKNNIKIINEDTLFSILKKG